MHTLRKQHQYRIVTLFLVLGFCSCDSGATQSEPDRLRILFVGNSLTYSNDMPEMLERMFVSQDFEPVTIESVAQPNYGLQDHWGLGDARSRIANGNWDIVIMQQGPSATEGRPSLLEYSELFAVEIRATGARPALYMVWPSTDYFGSFPGVSSSYRDAAELIDGMLFPAGEAWREAWKNDSGESFYGSDGFHPTILGSYLAALVIFDQLYDGNLSDLPDSIPGPGGDVLLSSEHAGLLHIAARRANENFAR